MMREVEAAHTLARHVTVSIDAAGRPKVEWHLPVSKTDQEAVGAVRLHGCSCTTSLDFACPAHAAWDQLTFLKAKFGVKEGAETVIPKDLVMFLDEDGCMCHKDAVTATIESAAVKLNVATSTPDGTARVSGHSLRVSGAQGLAHLGLDL